MLTPKQIQFYHNSPDPKIRYQGFWWRMKHGWTLEEAIKPTSGKSGRPMESTTSQLLAEQKQLRNELLLIEGELQAKARKHEERKEKIRNRLNSIKVTLKNRLGK